MKTICGIDCSACDGKDTCPGCEKIGGGGKCVIFACAEKSVAGGHACSSCRPFEPGCKEKERLMKEFNALGIEDMPEITYLNALPGSYINLEYTLPSGQKGKLWDDKRIYWANQIEKPGSDRCYGLTADENYLLVCEYGCNGTDPEIVCYKRRSK